MDTQDQPPKVLVVGAQGVLGGFIARAMTATGWDVSAAGRRPTDTPSVIGLDLADAQATSAACRGMDLIINTAHHPDLPLHREILSQGGILLDLTELSEPDRRHLEAETTAPQGLILIHTGLGGVAYLAIVDLLQANPEADGAAYALMASAEGSAGRAGGLFIHRLLTNFSHLGTSRIPFPEPIGTRRCLAVGGGYEGLLRIAVRGTPVDHYLFFQPRALNLMLLAVNFSRLIAALPRALFTAGARQAPGQPSSEPICEWVSVNRAGVRLASKTIQGRGYYAMTAAATVVFAQALWSRSDHPVGVSSIDEVLRLPELARALDRQGIAIQNQQLEPSG